MPDHGENAEIIPTTYTVDERLALLEQLKGTYEEIFIDEAATSIDRINDHDMLDPVSGTIDSEVVWFNGIGLEVVDEPPFYMVDYFLRPIMGPRLELHLEKTDGPHDAKRQLGRIARYITARGLEEAYPNIAAITYAPLIKATHNLSHLLPALATYFVSSSDHERVPPELEPVYSIYNDFLQKNGKPTITKDEFQHGALLSTTKAFVRMWQGQSDEK